MLGYCSNLAREEGTEISQACVALHSPEVCFAGSTKIKAISSRSQGEEEAEVA